MEDGQPVELESDKLLAQIEAAKSSTQEAQSPDKAPEAESEVKAAAAEPEGKSAQAVKQDVIETPAKADKSNDDVREWAKKKGIRDEESALRSLRELERKMHKMTFEEKAKSVEPRVTQYPPQYQPQPQWNQPVYSPPPTAPVYPYQMDREKIIQQEAKRYNMEPEDFERVLNLTNDLYAVKERQLKAHYDSQLQEIGKETRRNSELRELMQDPLFTNPKVQFEMHKVLEDNPQAFTHEPTPYLYAFNEAQRRLARQYLQDGGSVTEDKGSLPSEPPKEGSRGSSPVESFNKENRIMESFSKAKTADEQREILSRIGAVPTI